MQERSAAEGRGDGEVWKELFEEQSGLLEELRSELREIQRRYEGKTASCARHMEALILSLNEKNSSLIKLEEEAVRAHGEKSELLFSLRKL